MSETLKLFEFTLTSSPEWGKDRIEQREFIMAADMETAADYCAGKYGRRPPASHWCNYDRAEEIYALKEVSVTTICKPNLGQSYD